jgi:hypothetical protein
LLGIADVRQRPRAALVERGALIGEAQAARGAVEQLHAEARFQPRDRLADRRARQAHLLRRQRETGRFRRLDESGDAAQLVCHATPADREKMSTL